MANIRQRLPENAPGDFFVDATCIDCDACRQIAPAVFAELAESAYVRTQPAAIDDRRAALHALLSCPTGSIGCLGDDDPLARIADFPLPIEGDVFYCGFTSPKSFGGNSYFVRRQGGNWLIDSPRFVRPLVQRLEALGGVQHIFLTHQDDVADADRYAEHFRAQRYIHEHEVTAQPEAEVVLRGDAPREIATGIKGIPTPGHTAGHCCLLVEDRYLFTGDHLYWDRTAEHLAAFPDYCWHSWPQQIASMRRLTEYTFEWVLPGHGQRGHLPHAEMQRQLLQLITAM